MEDDTSEEELTPIQKLNLKRKQQIETAPDSGGIVDTVKSYGSSALGAVSDFVKAHPTIKHLLTGEVSDDEKEANRKFVLDSLPDKDKAKALDYETTHPDSKIGQVVGPPTGDSLLPEAKHDASEGWPSYLAKGAYNQVVRPLGSPEGMLGAASPGKMTEEAAQLASKSAVARGLPGNVSVNPVIKPPVIEPKPSQPSIEPALKPVEPPVAKPAQAEVQPLPKIAAPEPQNTPVKPTDDFAPEFTTKKPVPKVESLEDAPVKPIKEVVAKPNDIPKVESIGPEELKQVSVPGVPKVNDIPAPSTAKPISNDVNFLRAEFGSPDKTLLSRPESAPIAETIVKANDAKAGWIATTERDFADTLKGLDKSQRTTVGTWLNEGIPADMENTPLGLKTQILKAKLDKIHLELPEGIGPQGKDVGYIENYLTHIQKEGGDLGSGLKQIWEYHFKKPFDDLFPGRLGKAGKGEIADITDTIRTPGSKFAQERTGSMKNIELDVSKVVPAYIESIAKLKFDKQAVQAAEGMIRDLPASNLKDLATKYVANYSRLDAMPGLSAAWNDYTSRLMRTTSRSMLGFSTGLQTLHLARIPANLWPELGTKYLMKGIAKVATNPMQAYNETVGLGMLSNEIRPWAFKTTTQKLDSVMNFMGAADFLDRSIGYHGFKQMYLDQGMNETQATARAIASSKNASLMSDPARSAMTFHPEMSGASGPMWKLTTQFKQVPAKYIEQYLQIAANVKQNPKAAARAVMGTGLAFAAAEAGFHTFHISPKQFALDTGGASIREIKHITDKLLNGDVEGALSDTALFITPGGKSIKRQLEYGPSMFEQ